MPQWVVAQTYPLCEQRAGRHIERQGARAYAPFCYDNNQRIRLFPGYLFVWLTDAGGWLRSTIGILRVLCMGERMCVLPDEQILQYESMSDELGTVVLPPPPSFDLGQKVRIKEGAFAEHIGVVAGMDAHQRISVLLSLLGRESRVNLSAALVTAV